MNLNTDLLQTIEAENAVIGSVLLDNQVMDDICEMLEPRDFYIETNRLIWEGMQYQFRKNAPIDLVTMVTVLQRYDRLGEVGGVSRLSEIMSGTPTASNVKYYAEIVRSKAYRRRGNEAGIKIADLAANTEMDDEEYFHQIERIALSVRPQVNGDMKSLSETKQDYFNYLNEKEDFIYTGFNQFDSWMNGVGRGWLYILAGRPSVGKTAKALQMARGIAEQNVGEVLIWSQEMKRNQLLNRMLSPMTMINSNGFRNKNLTEIEMMRVKKAYEQLEQLPLHIEDARNVTIDEVRATGRQFKRNYGRIGAIFIDYLTIMKIIPNKGETRSQAVGYVTRTAKQIALELDCPIIMLAQLSREGKDEPKLEHLRDSGEIEQDADVVEFLWHNPEDTHRDGKVIQSIIAKGRDVGVNHFRYLFKGWIQKYEELAQ
ncbi:Replicative DNA helicase [Paenibacillus plantiphilus]|uniref:DNA 5'-3' helicase n=1 Tax=Paenibacillus plantiphilus TaxID=2905650 RepID=A0ABN8GCG9_9BACL|nr:DnaB-like helicase C-terminal domain-containing protein [Paenibacillus plantiphilus]CAH1205735.1 Replicative DNA helicase [Paenibacillus plantiphilus]